MVSYRRLSRLATNVVENRGGVDALKEDAKRLGDVAKGKGSITDKAKRAVDVVSTKSDPKDGRSKAGPIEGSGAAYSSGANLPRKD